MERSMDRRTNIWVRERTKLIDIIYTVTWAHINRLKDDRTSRVTTCMTRKDVKGDQPSGGETTWTNTGATRYGRGQHKTGSFGDDMLRPSPNHGTQRLPNDDDIYMGKAHEIGSSRVEKNWHFTLFTMFNVTPCFKHMDYRLSMSKKPCHTIFFSFRMVGPQSWVPRVTKSSCFLRYPQDSSDFLCFNHVQINTYDL